VLFDFLLPVGSIVQVMIIDNALLAVGTEDLQQVLMKLTSYWQRNDYTPQKK
jgi:hypothetical protein